MVLLGATMQALAEPLAGSTLCCCSEQRSPPKGTAIVLLLLHQRFEREGSSCANSPTPSHFRSPSLLLGVGRSMEFGLGGFFLSSVGFGGKEHQITLELCLRAAG